VATISRIDKIIGLFCRIASLLQVSFAKETYHFIEFTKCSHPILSPGWGGKWGGRFGVATISRLGKIIGLFCKRAL